MKWPNADVPKGTETYPEGPLTVKIVGQRDGETRNGAFSIDVSSRIVAPTQFAGQPYPFSFIIGVSAETAAKLSEKADEPLEEDLGAESPLTWKANPSARRYKNSYLKACGVEDIGDTIAEGKEVVGKTIVVMNANRADKNDPSKLYNDAKAFYNVEGSARNGKVARSAGPSTSASQAAAPSEVSGDWRA